ncbi:hypothetical protein [Enterovibrio baiacu]|uniref:hypothetical protein n=1 Tax=Enterovibrio baiacu TaxID=2491023 RepID=UPI001010A7FE|nr:hypothetical protein [Enterovibrio baiacu]MBE1276498.1 hypothetical protein [Enterovibrio baiacu]
MKVLIQYTQTGKYRDQAWEAPTFKASGEIQAVTPSYAAQMIEQNKACLVMSDDEHLVVDAN